MLVVEFLKLLFCLVDLLGFGIGQLFGNLGRIRSADLLQLGLCFVENRLDVFQPGIVALFVDCRHGAQDVFRILARLLGLFRIVIGCFVAHRLLLDLVLRMDGGDGLADGEKV